MLMMYSHAANLGLNSEDDEPGAKAVFTAPAVTSPPIPSPQQQIDLSGLAFEHRGDEFRPSTLENKTYLAMTDNLAAYTDRKAAGHKPSSVAGAGSSAAKTVAAALQFMGSRTHASPAAPASTAKRAASKPPAIDLVSRPRELTGEEEYGVELASGSDYDSEISGKSDPTSPKSQKNRKTEASHQLFEYNLDAAEPSAKGRRSSLPSGLLGVLSAAALRRSAGRYFSDNDVKLGIAGRNVVTSGLAVRGVSTRDEGDSADISAPLARGPYRGVRCYTCKKMGHVASDCPFRQQLVPCYLCAKGGHSSYNCPAGDLCFMCDGTGHLSASCPSKATLYETAKISDTGLPPGYGYRFTMALGPRAAAATRWARTRGAAVARNEYDEAEQLPAAERLDEGFCQLCSGRHPASACNGAASELKLIHCTVCGLKGHAYCNANVMHYAALSRVDSVVSNSKRSRMPWEAVLSPIAMEIAEVIAPSMREDHTDPLLRLFAGPHKELYTAHEDPTDGKVTCFNCGDSGHPGSRCHRQKDVSLISEPTLVSMYQEAAMKKFESPEVMRYRSMSRGPEDRRNSFHRPSGYDRSRSLGPAPGSRSVRIEPSVHHSTHQSARYESSYTHPANSRSHASPRETERPEKTPAKPASQPLNPHSSTKRPRPAEGGPSSATSKAAATPGRPSPNEHQETAEPTAKRHRGRSSAKRAEDAPEAANQPANQPAKQPYFDRNPDAAKQRDNILADPFLSEDAKRVLLAQVRKEVKKLEKRKSSG